MKHKSVLVAGKKGQYVVEFYDQEDGSILAKATGPVPFGKDLAWTSVVASATAKTKDEALRLIMDELQRPDT